MRSLTDFEVLQVWERGQRLHPVDRALALLAAANPNTSWEQLAHLPVGRRDEQLLSLREASFGSRFTSYTECPHCEARLEFEIEASQLRLPSPDKLEVGNEGSLEGEGYTIRFRLPDSFDLAAVAQSPDVSMARQTLLQRCVISVEREGIPANQLPTLLESQLAESIAQSDPQADLQLDLSCPACGHNWQLTFDIETFLWAEIKSLAKRLLREVHTLARAYGWREADILSMSAARRQAYLELVLG